MWIPPDECIVLVIDIENEYATDDIIEVNKENNPIMIRGLCWNWQQLYMSENGR